MYETPDAFFSAQVHEGDGVTEAVFSVRYVPTFHRCQITGYPLNITFISDKCRSSLAVVTTVKYESESKNLTSIFEKSNISWTKKNNGWSFSNPHLRAVAIYIRESSIMC